MINFTIRGTYANKFAHTIVKLSDPATAQALKWMGVKYVLVHSDRYLKTELVEDMEELRKIPYNPGIRFIKRFPAESCSLQDVRCVRETSAIDVYEVIAFPKEPKIE
jgi:hypothetical protein